MLDAATTKPLTLLVAPAGCGKTVGIAEWASQTDLAVAWTFAYPGQSTSNLVRDLLAACGAETDPPPSNGGAGEVVRRLQACGASRSVLVVDDAHYLDSASWSLLEDVIMAAPAHVRIVAALRRDPPLSTVALDLGDLLTVIRADVLRFSDDEARRLIAAHSRTVTAEDVEALLRRAGGWAAALVLGARALASAPDRMAARTALLRTDRPVLDFLLGEVFASLPATTRHILLCTATETVVTEQAAVAASGVREAAVHLSALAAEGFLVTVLSDGRGRSWRYHPLLRELLRRQVAVDGVNHALARAAHIRATGHYRLHGPVVEAVRHAQETDDHELLAEVLVEAAPTLLSTGHRTDVDQALRALPPDMAQRQPALLGVTALQLRSDGDYEAAVRVAGLASREAERTLERSDGETGDVPAAPSPESALVTDAALLNTWLARYGWRNVDRAVRGARQVLDEGLVEPARLSGLLHELAVAELGVGNITDASLHANEALLAAHALHNREMTAAALSSRCRVHLLTGRLQAAADAARECIRTTDGDGALADEPAAAAHVVLGWAAFQDVRFPQAESELAEAERANRSWPDPLVSTLALNLGARLLAEHGHVVEARRRLAAPAPLSADTVPEPIMGLFAINLSYVALMEGDAAEVCRQAHLMRKAGWGVIGEVFSAISDDLAGDARGALGELDRILANHQPEEQLCSLVLAAGYRVSLLLREGRTSLAAESLSDALTRCAPQRLLQPLLAPLVGNVQFERLLRDSAFARTAHPFAASALDALHRYRAVLSYGDGQRSTADRQSAQGDSALAPQPLTKRETEVLHELALGGSYRDVADSLFVTENTVKTHVASLYRKLGVDRRGRALRRARETGLL